MPNHAFCIGLLSNNFNSTSYIYSSKLSRCTVVSVRSIQGCITLTIPFTILWFLHCTFWWEECNTSSYNASVHYYTIVSGTPGGVSEKWWSLIHPSSVSCLFSLPSNEKVIPHQLFTFHIFQLPISSPINSTEELVYQTKGYICCGPSSNSHVTDVHNSNLYSHEC